VKKGRKEEERKGKKRVKKEEKENVLLKGKIGSTTP
jgi:hypothetical protein